MTTRMTFLGNAGYEIVSDTQRILIDPYPTGIGRSPDELDTPDAILVTHAAFNHFGDTVEIAKRTGAPIVCAVDVAAILSSHGIPDTQILATVYGIRSRVNGVTVHPLPAMHFSFGRDANGVAYSGPPLAYLVEPEPGLRLLHTADTAMFDMSWIGRLYRPTLAWFCVSMPWEDDAPECGEYVTAEITPWEAGEAAEMLQVQAAVATHYVSTDRFTDEFCREVVERDTSGTRLALAPESGDVIVAEGADASWGFRIER